MTLLTGGLFQIFDLMRKMATDASLWVFGCMGNHNRGGYKKPQSDPAESQLLKGMS
ncbi:hypothetical protein [Silvimonas amylolytica]|uniref:hypothetical protein n=1 Tax=Silvimonas amylolytica TaxID=449663 RepID=UPI00166CF152|nr:hypothetical protein [Silvimonas amylolytica]